MPDMPIKWHNCLLKKVSGLPQIKITQKVEANAVFAIIPAQIIEALQEKYFFYVWDENRNEVRWMTSFDTTPEDIDGFADYLEDAAINDLSVCLVKQ